MNPDAIGDFIFPQVKEGEGRIGQSGGLGGKANGGNLWRQVEAYFFQLVQSSSLLGCKADGLVQQNRAS